MGKNVSLVKIVASLTHNQKNAPPAKDKKYTIQLPSNAIVQKA